MDNNSISSRSSVSPAAPMVAKQALDTGRQWVVAAWTIFLFNKKRNNMNDLELVRAALTAFDKAEELMKKAIKNILLNNGNIIKASEESVNLHPIYVEICLYEEDDHLLQILSVKLDGESIYIDTDRGEYEVTRYDNLYDILESIEKGWLIIKQHGAGEN